jgi:hypothetical protein
MKTFVPFKIIFAAVALTVCALLNDVLAQSGSGGGTGSGNNVLNNGLDFSKNPVLQTPGTTHLKQGAIYRVEDVAAGVDARIRIDSLVNGARITQIDDNSNGLGYKQAFQPEIRTGNVIAGKSYAVFTISFYKENTTIPEVLYNVNATALDIDGNVNLKEFADINVGNGGTARFMSTSLDLSLLQLLTGRFIGQNILGIERDGIDTSSYNNMFTASNNSGMSSITIRYGALTVLPEQDERQFSLYMKGFMYPNQVTLPVELVSFTATLNDAKKAVDLKWTTATEKNVSHFVVEKSLDGQNYSDAGVVFAYGNTSDRINYTFTDKNINAGGNGVIYYRLRSVDIDAKSQLSAIRIIRIGKEMESIAVVTYPNPVSNELRITIPSGWQGKKVSYEVLANNGRMTIRTESGSSSQTETLNVSSLSPGFYVVRVTCNGETATQKIVKQ